MSIEGTIQLIAEQLIKVLKAQRCTIRWPDGRLIVICGKDAGPREEKIAMDETTIAGQAAITKQIFNVPDIRKHHLYNPACVQNENLIALLTLPLILSLEEDENENEVLGIAQIYREESFSAEDEENAKILAKFAAPALYKIGSSKMSRRAMRELVSALFDCATPEETFPRAIEIISKRVRIESCLIYKVFPRFDGKTLWCEIVAGAPPGEHEIGLSEPLEKHPDIKGVTERKQIEIKDLLTDGETEHLRDWAKTKQIRKSMYVPLILKGKSKEDIRAIGVMIWEARKEKMGFSAEEKSFAFDSGEIIAQLTQHDIARDKNNGIVFKEIEDAVLNSSQAMAGFAERSFEPILQIHKVTERICKKNIGICEGADIMCANVATILPNAVTIKTEAKKIDSKVSRIRQTHFERT